VTTRRFLGFIPVNRTEEQYLLWDFLNANARKSSQFKFSGSVFCELDLFLAREHSMIFDLGLREPSERITTITKTSMALFSHEAAQKVTAMLSRVDCSATAIRQYAETGDSAYTADEMIEPLQAAANQTKIWMNDVGPSDLGLLIVD